MIKDALRKLSYIIFPRRCIMCGDVVELDKEKCDTCLSKVKITGEVCDVCGLEKQDCDCNSKTKKPEYKRVIAPYVYDIDLAKAMHRFKLYGYKELGDCMAFEIAQDVTDKYSDVTFDIVSCIPMTKRKERKRGYNQSELLAVKVADEIGVPFCKTLIKSVETSNQRGSTAQERQNNLFGSFDVIESLDLKDKTVLLIDDVKTTGSTFNECATMLKAYGADVYCAAFAVVKKRK